jgi:endonuclease V-like protein UPF0215 family
MRMFEICCLALFIAILLSSVIFGVFNMSGISLALLIIDFPLIAVVAVYGSLSIREEEEEKT